MRTAIAACVFALVACSPPSSRPEPPPQHPIAEASGAGRVEAPVLALASEAVVGRWSFDRSCGLYDLVLNADASANYYDYRDQHNVVSYAGRWARGETNRVVLRLRRLGETGAPTGDVLTYNFDVSDQVTDDLIGQFGPASGDMRAINAKRCPEEDRE